MAILKPTAGKPLIEKPFMQDIQELRRKAREHIREGAVTQDYKGNLETAHRLLNGALATEIVCTLRYKYHYLMADGLPSDAVKDEFLEHSKEEQEHADMIAVRIVQLDGKPDLNPANLLSQSAAEYKEGTDIIDMIEEDLIAERIAIEHYRELVAYFAPTDPTTRRMLEEILAKEEEHAEEMASLLTAVRNMNPFRGDLKLADDIEIQKAV